METCSITGCNRPTATRGWCAAHYTRWRRHGDVGGVEVATKGVRRECAVEGCGRAATSRKMCGKHYLRMLRKGTVEVLPKSGPGSLFWRDREDLTYDAAHDRVKRQRGRASEHSCGDCGSQAEDWAYQHQASAPLADDLGRPYSEDVSDYAPMCRPCHRRFDMRQSRTIGGADGLFVVTVEEAALYAGVSTTTVRAWCRRGLLSPITEHVKPLLYRYEEVAIAQRDARPAAWVARHAQAVARWRACA